MKVIAAPAGTPESIIRLANGTEAHSQLGVIIPQQAAISIAANGCAGIIRAHRLGVIIIATVADAIEPRRMNGITPMQSTTNVAVAACSFGHS